MNYPYNRCRKEGVSYRPWAERVIELCKDEGIEPPELKELQILYNQNFYYNEAKLFARFKTMSHVWMELHVKDDKGTYIERFNSSEHAKEFFSKFPKLREYLQNS